MRGALVVFLSLSLALLWFWARPESSRAETDEPMYVPREIIICFRPNVSLPVEGSFKSRGSGLTNEALVALDESAGIVRVERVAPALPAPDDRAAALERVERNNGPRTLKEVAAIFSEYGQDRTIVLQLAENVDVPKLAAVLMQRYPDMVEFAEPNYLRRVSLTPNDPLFSRQWHLNRVEAEEAWEETTGSPAVAIAVIDTGISSHPDLDMKRFINPDEIPDNGFDDDGNGFADDVSGWDFVNRDNDPDEEFTHGTLVSGVAGADTNNGRDIAGMSWGSPILPLKAGGDEGTISTRAELRALNYAVMMAVHGVHVINMSFGGPARSGAELNAIRAAGAANILCVAAAGNERRSNDDFPSYPSTFETETENVIGVTATDRRDRIAAFSNFGLTVGVAAPGDGIVTLRRRSGATTISGTSFSAPLVSGVAALIYSRFPESTPLQVRGRIEGNVDLVDALRGRVLSGGRVNAWRVFEIDEVPPAPITDLQVVEDDGDLVLTWTAPGDDGMDGRASFYDIRARPSTSIQPNDLRFTQRLVTPLQPGEPGATETLALPDDFLSGRFFVLIRVLDNVGNLAESNQVEINIEE